VGQPDQEVGTPMMAATESSRESSREAAASVDSDPSYVVPTSTSSSAFIPATRLTNYVVAHSEYSSPLGRRSVLTGVLADDEELEAEQQAEDPVEVSISTDPER
jgi:hypothetical protein